MTIHEAIKQLQNASSFSTLEQNRDAIEMAIKSLLVLNKIRFDLDNIKTMYLEASQGQYVMVYPKWNVDRIIDKYFMEMEDGN